MKVKRLVCMSLVVAMFLLVYLFGSLIAIPAKAATQERDVSYSADYTINSEYIDSYLETKDVAEDDGRIQELFMERSDVVSAMQFENSQELESKLAEIDSELQQLGVYKASNNEVSKIFSSGETATMQTQDLYPPTYPPEDTETIDWFTSLREKQYDGQTYRLFIMTATPKQLGTPLESVVTSNNYYNKNELAGLSLEFLLEQITGFIPYLSWIPIDIDLTTATNAPIQFMASLMGNTTMMYIFVYHENLEIWDFTIATHYTEVTSNIVFSYMDENGVTQNQYSREHFNVYAPNYDNLNYAIRFFKENREHQFVSGHPSIDSVPGIMQTVLDQEMYLQFQFYPLPAVLY